MIVDLRFPGAAKAALALSGVLFSFWVLFVPPWGRRDLSPAALAAEVIIAFGLMFVASLAVLCAVAFLFTRWKALAHVYSWTAVGIVAGNACLLMTGYWQATGGANYAHYGFARPVAVMSIVSVTPALIAQVVHFVWRRAD